MLTEDYIMRMISQALAVIMTALGLKKAGKYQEALQNFDQAKEVLLGLDARLVDQLEDAALIDRLTSLGTLDVDRVFMLADIYDEEGEIFSLLGHESESVFSFQRSLRLYLEGALSSEASFSLETIQKIEAIRPKLTVESLPAETCLALLDYLDRLLDSGDEFLGLTGISRSRIQEDHTQLTAQCDMA